MVSEGRHGGSRVIQSAFRHQRQVGAQERDVRPHWRCLCRPAGVGDAQLTQGMADAARAKAARSPLGESQEGQRIRVRGWRVWWAGEVPQGPDNLVSRRGARDGMWPQKIHCELAPVRIPAPPASVEGPGPTTGLGHRRKGSPSGADPGHTQGAAAPRALWCLTRAVVLGALGGVRDRPGIGIWTRIWGGKRPI